MILREVIDADLPILFEYQQDSELNFRADCPPRDAEANDTHLAKIRNDPNVFMRVIVSEGTVAGMVNRFERDGEIQIGYWLGREFWGRGIATLALNELLRIDATRPLLAHVVKDNLSSLRVLQKNGFVIFDEYTEKAWFREGDVSLWKLRLDSF